MLESIAQRNQSFAKNICARFWMSYLLLCAVLRHLFFLASYVGCVALMGPQTLRILSGPTPSPLLSNAERGFKVQWSYVDRRGWGLHAGLLFNWKHAIDNKKGNGPSFFCASLCICIPHHKTTCAVRTFSFCHCRFLVYTVRVSHMFLCRLSSCWSFDRMCLGAPACSSCSRLCCCWCWGGGGWLKTSHS